jgi:PncC family amidohydrolase
MAVGVRGRFDTDIGMGITGIAGPEGGTEDKPVGLVFISLATANGCRVQRFQFAGSRAEIREAACDAALRMLKDWLDK